MKEIFKKIEGRGFDWFGYAELNENWVYSEPMFYCNYVSPTNSRKNMVKFSLADLLVNKSWRKAVWRDSGEGGNIYERNGDHTIECEEVYSIVALYILQQEGKKACIKYIKKTMI
jgi:hypothetical protein